MIKKNKERNVIKLVRKSNELVEARYKFDIWETRVFTKMLTMIHKDDGDFKSYRIYLKDVVRDFGLETNNDAYERLRAGGMKLMSKIVKVIRNTDEGLMELNTPIVVGVESLINKDKKVEDAKFIDVSFHPGMKPFLLSLKSHFTTYDVRNILKLPSSYSIRIYELLKQYQKIGKRKFLVQELKEIIGVIEEVDVNGKKKMKDNYPLFGNFKQRVLLKAQRDLATFTDISFTFDQIKKGRAVHEVLFYISANSPQQDSQELVTTTRNNQATITKEALVEELHEWVKEWVSLSVVRNWVKKYPEAQIRKGIEYTLNQLKSGKELNNVGGYLQKMVQEEDLVDPMAARKKKLQDRKEQERQQKELKHQLEEALKMLQLEYLKKEDSIINSLLEIHPNLHENMLKQIQKTKFATYDGTISFEQNMTNPMLKAAYRNAIKKHQLEAFESIRSTYEAQIKQLKNKIAGL